MKRIISFAVKSLLAILIGGMLLATRLHAQNDLVMTVSIPFPFTVGALTMAPGSYQFSLVSSQFLLSIRNVKTGEEELFEARPEQGAVLKSRTGLVFRTYKRARVLNEVHFSETDTFTQVVQLRHVGRDGVKSPSPNTPVSVAQR